MRLITGLIAGSLFGIGLTISDMVNPKRVLGFLDIAGEWDPTLLFVMGGAMLPMFISWFFVKKLKHPLCETDFQIPSKQRINVKLIMGSALFGIGWGTIGICPGPSLASIGTGNVSLLIFVSSMIAGMLLFKVSPFKA
ncbi:DUF6691 family protein [Curvivirga aplysinae]|uniref:DUF6691 family protein n=1 Tax=Curvivirga aplysinae TaxID=2529852 RepID=UPI001C3F7075|nr:DUF6691 family protein [Curvivirga aplysinae]